MPFARLVLPHVVRFAASSQAGVALLLHGAWLLLAAAVWQAEGGAAAGSVTRTLVRAFAWLGGVGPDGHGDAGNVVQAMFVLTIPVYLLAELRIALGGERWTLGRTLRVLPTLSFALAYAGFAYGFRNGGGVTGAEAAWLAALFATIAAAATAWAVLADWLGERAVAALEVRPAAADRPACV